MTSCKMKKTTIRLFALCIFYLIFLLIGAAIFSAIEYSNEQDLITQVKQKRQKFLSDNDCINDTELETFIARIIEANSRGISAISNLTVEPNWSFGQAVFFAGTVLTTIGYGHVSPLSAGGKVFCMFYAIVGIPMSLIMISACVERLLLLANKLQQLFKTKFCSQFNDKCINYTFLMAVFTFVLLFFFIIPAAIFSSIEKEWDYLDAFYYCFISLSTIGLGDYIPGDRNEQPVRALYKIATTIYLIIGIMFVMLFLNVVIQIPELNFPSLFAAKDANDPERECLTGAVNSSTSYTRQIDDDDLISNHNEQIAPVTANNNNS